ncbi:MAG: nickel insertion protein, partial [Candidatus Hydrogenedentota bacterium]
MKTLYFDCFCGAAGDMIVGALIDAGADFETLKKSLDTLGVDGYTLSCEKINKHGTMATKFDVHVDDEHDHPHRHLRHIVEIIEAGDLPD